MSIEIRLRNHDEARTLLGPLDRTAKLFHDEFGVQLVARGDILKLLGEEDDVTRARSIVERALRNLRRGHPVSHADFERWVRGDDHEEDGQKRPSPAQRVAMPAAKRAGVRARTDGQRNYLRALEKNTVCFAVGPAGTGKTYLAVAAAVASLREGRFQKIVLCRPAVEAGEKLGFLPGDFQAKVNPYLRPLYDALGNILDPALTQRYLENDVIEVCPLAFMRGRTLNDAFIILDEAQNTTVSQMRMFLTRMGERSQVVVTGDLTQVDLQRGTPSGLADAIRRLEGVQGLTVVRLDREDIVRHPIVQRIVDAYESSQNRMPSPEDRAANPVRGSRQKR
ncbi:MAG: PhoH family protein [Planctomycetes bacterium]|nr:PhoH family protein [Planctomycetota bacterium]